MGAAHSINGPIDLGFQIKQTVWFAGTTAILEGQGLCYDWDYGTDATKEPSRGARVEVPAILNAPYFAGVATQAYSAKSTGQFIDIFLPGSVCNIYSAFNNVIGVGVSTFEVGTGGDAAGSFGRGGFPGRGSATPLQTIDRSTPGLCLAYLHDGPQSGGIEVVTPPTTGTAITLMVGGVTYLIGTVAIGSADATFTLADGTYSGQKKAFVCEGTYSSNDVEVTVTSGLLADGATNLATVSFNADLEEMELTWHSFDTNGQWVVDHTVGAALTA